MAKDTTGWFKHQLTFDGIDFTTASTNLRKACSDHVFEIRKETSTEANLSLEAMYGSRLIAFLIGLIPCPKPVFIPSERGPKWCWGAFIIPEVWFLWHEIWGASILAFIVENVAVQVIEPKGFGLYVAIAGFLSVRVFTGLWGHRIYYYRYGKWLKTSSNHATRPDKPVIG